MATVPGNVRLARHVGDLDDDGHDSGPLVADLDDLSDVTITAPADGDTLMYNGSAWVNDTRRWEPVTDGEDVFVWESDDLVSEWRAY